MEEVCTTTITNTLEIQDGDEEFARRVVTELLECGIPSDAIRCEYYDETGGSSLKYVAPLKNVGVRISIFGSLLFKRNNGDMSYKKTSTSDWIYMTPEGLDKDIFRALIEYGKLMWIETSLCF